MADQGQLVLSGVTKKFGDAVAVSSFDLNVGASEFVSLLGPSGCGKTTTLRMIAGLEQPTSGEIRLKGKVLNGLQAFQRNVSLVFQNFALFPHLTVFDNVAYGLKLRRLPRTDVESRVESMLETVDMTELADRKPAQLSGGQQQRVALGRALVVDPDLLLLDEPLGSLDAHLRIQMQAELQLLQRRLQIPFVYVTHNQNEALSMSDRVVVMRDGSIEQIASPVELFSKPETRFVASFVGNNNLLSATAVEQQGDLVFQTAFGNFRAKQETKISDGVDVSLVFGADILQGWEPDMAEKEWNQISGVIDGVEVVGSITTYVLRLPDGSSLNWEQHGTSRTHIRVRPGERMTLCWPVENTVVLLEGAAMTSGPETTESIPS